MLILECAGLDMNAVKVGGLASLGLEFQPLTPVFPAVTCVAQATMRTGLPPKEHGIIANGRYDRKACRVEFWGQSAGLYRGERLWERFPSREVAVMFLQQSLGDRGVRYSFSPAPIHRHHGGMLMGCHANPPELEAELNKSLGNAETLTLDFSKLEYISSAGLRVLLAAHKTMLGKGGMKVTNVNEIVAEVFEVTGFADILTIE